MAISLRKNEKVSLAKSGSTLRKIFLGAGWDVAKSSSGSVIGRLFGGDSSAPNIDLDASCLMFDGTGNLVDSVWFSKLRSNCHAVVHSGDNLTGEGEGDDEVIHVNLETLPSNIVSLVFTINSFRGQTFEKVKNAFVRLVDTDTNKEIARYDLSDSGPYTGLIMATVRRDGADWSMEALGIRASGRTVHDMIPAINAISSTTTA